MSFIMKYIEQKVITLRNLLLASAYGVGCVAVLTLLGGMARGAWAFDLVRD